LTLPQHFALRDSFFVNTHRISIVSGAIAAGLGRVKTLPYSISFLIL